MTTRKPIARPLSSTLRALAILAVGFFLLILGLESIASARPKVTDGNDGRVSVVKLESGSWQLQVSRQPYLVKGVVFSPVKIGESPEEATMRDWMVYDDDGNSKNDIAYSTWRSSDPQHNPVGDFQMLKEMGANTIRLYHVPTDNPVAGDVYKMQGTDAAEAALQFDHALNKELLRALYRDFNIRVIVGNFLGSWTIGSGARWAEGTDYMNPLQREKIKRAVKAMVLDSKDEPYVLMWMLGNENNIADWSHCNAKSHPIEYAKLIGELAEMIHQIDPNHPVAVCDGDDHHRMLKYYAQYAPQIDVIAYNVYRGPSGFGSLWAEAKAILDRPILISEYGHPAYRQGAGEDEELQLRYVKAGWQEIVNQSAEQHDGKNGSVGNSIGGTVFDWVDRWYMDGSPSEHNPGKLPNPVSPDQINHQEWWGMMAMHEGDRSDSLMRRPRKAYFYFRDAWNDRARSF